MSDINSRVNAIKRLVHVSSSDHAVVAFSAIAANTPISEGDIAIADILPGNHTHSHEMRSKLGQKLNDYCDAFETVESQEVASEQTFRGYRRTYGRVNSRNVVAHPHPHGFSQRGDMTVIKCLEQAYTNVQKIENKHKLEEA